MDTGSLLLITAIIILSIFIVSRPFYSVDPVGSANASHDGRDPDYELSELMVEKERLLSALRDLDSDHDLGKVPDLVYHEQRGRLLREAALNLRSIDELENTAVSGGPQANFSVDPKVETGLPQRWDEVEDQIAERRRKRSEKSAGFCPHCGKVLQKSDYFCPACGAKV